MEPPYQSRPLLQRRRRRRSSAASAAALCSPSERHRVSRPPQPPRRAATTPSRPLGPRPRPPRCAHCRLRLRAADAAATDAAASSFAPPSFSLKANKHHGGGRRPPASEHPDRRRRSNIPAAHWPPPPGATIRCPAGWVAPARRALAPPPRTPPALGGGGPARRAPGPALPLLFPLSVALSPLRPFSLLFFAALCFPIYSPRPFLCPRLFTFVASLRSLSSVSFPFVLLPVTWKRGPVLRLEPVSPSA